MESKKKRLPGYTVRMDPRVSRMLGKFCKDGGFVRERLTEAILLNAARKLTISDAGKLLEEAHRWKRGKMSASRRKPKA